MPEPMNPESRVRHRSRLQGVASVACAVLFAVALAPLQASADEPAIEIQAGASSPVAPDHRAWRGVTLAYPARGVSQQMLDASATATAVTLPHYSAQVTSPLDHKKYTFYMVGSNPTASTKTSTTIAYVPIALRMHFDDGSVMDPYSPGCHDNVSVSNRFLGSPIFQNVSNVSNGINVGTTQVIDAFQRAEFWSYTKNTNYHVLLKGAASVRRLDIYAHGYSTVAGVCPGSTHNVGIIDQPTYDGLLQSIATKYAAPNQLPIIFAYNVVLSDSSGNCCILGYHSAYGRGINTQVYGTGAYLDSGLFRNTDDIATWTHELGELFNDPFVNDGTPAWGHTGQVSGCQNNFETGDPLSGTEYTITANGFRYHPQEQAFFDWFYRTPSKATGGKYSYEGKFRSVQGACH